ncbi:MAG: hypothetical protein HOM01_09805, partial [Kordiimonadaceae bacterium]|nr:hypothetical protein [Kordiimonadaceae bacterium]
MFQNYLKIALRNFLKYKLDSFLNVTGLVIGMAAALLISLFVKDEYGYDTQWSDAERLYRLQTTWIIEGRDDLELANSSGPIKPALKPYFEGEIEASARLNRFSGVVKLGDNQFRERISMADPEFLDIFDLEIISGDARAALSDHSSIIISERFAEKYFGVQDPLGQTVTLVDLKEEYTVAAVMADLGDNTHLVIDTLIAVNENSPEFGERFTSWNEANNHIYFKLTENGDINAVNERMVDFVDYLLPSSTEGLKNSETNILSCMLAKKLGVKKTIAEIENIDFIELAKSAGIDTIINKKLIAASHIFRFTMKAKVVMFQCLSGMDAEVLEFVVQP